MGNHGEESCPTCGYAFDAHDTDVPFCTLQGRWGMSLKYYMKQADHLDSCEVHDFDAPDCTCGLYDAQVEVTRKDALLREARDKLLCPDHDAVSVGSCMMCNDCDDLLRRIKLEIGEVKG